ncbi:16S rRNA (uracil(1498)-N(3))-methyltransferase [Buchnera aphidicola (Neophyllaphis podocarpi)]|uniref:16S rRNA (uracil(1498)-N(3))-methyltransferase n=1 Tax=Buchnera aphidicola TaxID=9 RepID=UPI0031B82566
MKIYRIYLKNNNIKINKKILISNIKQVHYLNKVVRIKSNDLIEIFNNSKYIYHSKITNLEKNNIHIKIIKVIETKTESFLQLHLGQVISKKQNMDFTIQKSVELGVKTITPLISEKCYKKYKSDIYKKKIIRWTKIAESACHQCKRNILLKINDITELKKWCIEQTKALKIFFNPYSSISIKKLPKKHIKNIRLLIGSEHGFSSTEIELLKKNKFNDILLGPRILRTETASITAISILQFKYGDI